MESPSLPQQRLDLHARQSGVRAPGQFDVSKGYYFSRRQHKCVYQQHKCADTAQVGQSSFRMPATAVEHIAWMYRSISSFPITARIKISLEDDATAHGMPSSHTMRSASITPGMGSPSDRTCAMTLA